MPIFNKVLLFTPYSFFYKIQEMLKTIKNIIYYLVKIILFSFLMVFSLKDFKILFYISDHPKHKAILAIDDIKFIKIVLKFLYEKTIFYPYIKI